MRVLIYDSNLVFARRVSSVIHEHVHNAEVDIAHNVPVLKRRLEENKYDIVLADVDVSVDGVLAKPYLQEARAAGTSVLLWTFLEREDRELVTETACSFKKPVSVFELNQAVETLVHR